MEIAITKYSSHIVGKVYINGRVYAVTFAPDTPDVTEARVQRLWREERELFAPYNESTGTYVEEEDNGC